MPSEQHWSVKDIICKYSAMKNVHYPNNDIDFHKQWWVLMVCSPPVMWVSWMGNLCLFVLHKEVFILPKILPRYINCFTFRSMTELSTNLKLQFSLDFSPLFSERLHSWSKVNISSIQQSTLKYINIRQWGSPLWTAAAVMLINGSEKSFF